LLSGEESILSSLQLSEDILDLRIHARRGVLGWLVSFQLATFFRISNGLLYGKLSAFLLFTSGLFGGQALAFDFCTSGLFGGQALAFGFQTSGFFGG
jgi:hypothetical protein